MHTASIAVVCEQVLVVQITLRFGPGLGLDILADFVFLCLVDFANSYKIDISTFRAKLCEGLDVSPKTSDHQVQ
jgi:hypothetical protein